MIHLRGLKVKVRVRFKNILGHHFEQSFYLFISVRGVFFFYEMIAGFHLNKYCVILLDHYISYIASFSNR